MSTLAYQTMRGAGVVLSGTAAELGPKLARLRTHAVLRSNHGAVIGGVQKCGGEGDGCSPRVVCSGWHWWFDATGDGVQREVEA